MKKYLVKIKKITPLGICKAYDVFVDSKTHSYIANGFVIHNCLHSGQAQKYSNIKSGKEKLEYLHPILESLTKKTCGQILYQEQVMQIMNKIGGFSWSTAEQARKIITKSKGKDAFNKMRIEFVRNAVKLHNMKDEEAERLYDIVCTFGSYGFNLSHAVEYSIISYHCAWLKTYFPEHFFKAVLKYETDEAEIKNIVQDAKQFGVTFEYPDINKSFLTYETINNKIYAGLNSINGIGLKVAEKIIAGRPYLSFQDFKTRCTIAENLMSGLIVSEAFREFNVNKKQLLNGNLNGQKTLFFLQTEEEKEKENNNNKDLTEQEQAKIIYERTSLTPTLNIIKSFNFGEFNFINIEDLKKQENFNKQVFIRGIITDSLKKDKLLFQSKREHIHKFEKRLIYLNLNDGTGNIACQINPETYEKYSKILKDIKKCPVIIYGCNNVSGTKIFVDMIDIVDGKNKTEEIKNIFNQEKLIKEYGTSFIVSSHPRVSKNDKSYYNIVLSNGIKGLCFFFNEKLFPGMKVAYNINKEPFINLEVITNKES